MRSLTLLTCQAGKVHGKKAAARYTSLAVRNEATSLSHPDDKETLYLASERPLPDGGVEVQVFVANSQLGESNTPIVSFQAPPEPPFQFLNDRHIVDFRFLAENLTLVIVLAGGDIVCVDVNEDTDPSANKVDVVGSVEAGIHAAAWSPDEELLVLVTGEDNLVEMTKTFDVLSEGALQTVEFGQDKPVNLGWGAQETQFHGSIGKSGRDAVAGLPAASALAISSAQAAASSSTSPQLPNITQRDSRCLDEAYRISWRGDGAFFVVTSLHDLAVSNKRERRLRFYSRTAVLQSTSEPTPGLESPLAWQPSGSIVAATAEQSSQVVFFERNGLRRYEFSLRNSGKVTVMRLAWNSDSTVLAVWIRTGTEEDDDLRDTVQLWRRNNYHWYLKQSIQTASSDNVQDIVWDAEQELSLYLVLTSSVEKRVFMWDTYRSNRQCPNDTGLVAVVDGAKLLLTPFRYQNVPPPMCSLELDTGGQTPVHVAFHEDDDSVAALFSDGSVMVWRLCIEKGGKVSSQGRIMTSIGHQMQGSTPKQLVLSRKDGIDVFSVLASTHRRDHDCIFTVSIPSETEQDPPITKRILAHSFARICMSHAAVYLQTVTGAIFDAEDSRITEFSEFCPSWQCISDKLMFGLSAKGTLLTTEKLIAANVSSFLLTGDFLVYTTLAHEVRFAKISTLASRDGILDTQSETADYIHALKPAPVEDATRPAKPTDVTYARRVERGSRIVTVVPSSMSVVLQMPRGNLETICPRPLVLQIVQRHLEAKQYKDAYLICRRHRIDLNFLCDFNFDVFVEDVPKFLDAVADPEYLNVFISGLKDVDVTRTLYASLCHDFTGRTVSPSIHSKVNTLCHRIRLCLEEKDILGYMTSIITTHTCQRPADYVSALQVIRRVKAISSKKAEEAVRFIIYLADSATLYDVALGTYDFELVLAVAQQSQKDPKEYIPFLRGLRKYPEHYQHFKIDDHLRKYAPALTHLAAAGADYFQEALSYIAAHDLYDAAVQSYKDQASHLQVVLEKRGDWLMQDDRCPEAALSYTMAGQPRKAMIAYQRALNWVELFALASQVQLAEQDMITLAENVASGLRNRNRHNEASKVLCDYAKNIPAAIQALCDGADFGDALRLATLHRQTGLVNSLILPQSLDAKEKILDEVNELEDQVTKQVSRLAELREKRLNNTASFYGKLLPGVGDDALDNVDVQTEAGASTVATTQFTRYTKAAASTRASIKSGKTRKSDRRALNKAAGGGKGSVYEESYLLGSLTRLVSEGGKLSQLVASTASLTRLYVRLSQEEIVRNDEDDQPDLLDQGRELEDGVTSFLDLVQRSIDEVWTALGDAQLHDLEAALLQADNEENAEVLKRPAKPKIANLGHWKVPLLALLV